MAVNKVVYNAKVLLDLTSDTVKPDKLVKGYTAHGANGNQITGTLAISGVIDTSNNIILSGDLADGAYTVMFGDTVIGIYTQGVLYTNVLPTAIDCNGDVFFGNGYIDGYYLGGNKYSLDKYNYMTAGTGYFSTGFIPYTNKQAQNCIPFYVKGVDINLSSLPANMKASLFSDYNRTDWQGFMVFSSETAQNNMTIEKLGDKYYKITPNKNFYTLHSWNNQNTKYIRFSFAGSGAGVIITVDEPIE